MWNYGKKKVGSLGSGELWHILSSLSVIFLRDLSQEVDIQMTYQIQKLGTAQVNIHF